MGEKQLKVARPTNDFADPQGSSRSGLSGLLETVLRRFKNAFHLALVLPFYIVGCALLGLAAAPGVALASWIMGLASGQTGWIWYPAAGFSLAVGYFTYGFTLLFLIPLVNFCTRLNLRPWRGPYYSLDAIRWYLHNGLTYGVRYTFLEFVTPTPFNILFYRMMGMKIGHTVTINTTFISDPSMIEMGDKVTIGGSVTLVAHYGQGGYLVLAPLKIGNGVTIGLKATIMGGVTIGDGAKILPNSVVMPKTNIPPGEIWGGVPAKKLDL